jgi:predicted patatin/cPLA2 family phospholipase
MTVTPFDRDVAVRGTRAQSVINVLQGRLRSGSRDDGNRLALVVEGGAMRGIYTAGSLLGLHALGASQCFDDVYATSAGAVNAAYFLSGTGETGVDAYYRLLTDGRFFSLRRPWKVMDIDFLVDQVLDGLRPINHREVVASSTRFWVAVTDFVTAKPTLFCAQTAGFPLLQLLRAAVALPVFSNRLVRLGQVEAFDAAICNPFPIREAITDGATHVLVLLSRTEGHRELPRPFWQHLLFDSLFARGDARLSRMLRDSYVVTNELRALALGETRVPGFDPAIATLTPNNAVVGEATQRSELLRSELLRVARGTLRLFASSESKLEGWLASGRI